IIQAAICRQREYLADAASVQYTRQTTGLASALHKLMVASEGTGLRHAALAGELNHMCIGESLASHRWLASHPPLQARITAIDSGFLRAVRIRKNQGVLAKRRAARKGTVGMATVAGGDTEDAMVNPHVSARVGHWGRRELAWAGTVREALVE